MSEFRFPLRDASGQITAGGTSQEVFAANVHRKYLYIQNPDAASEVLAVNIGAVAAVSGATSTVGASYELGAGKALQLTAATGVPPGAVNVNAATTNHVFIAKEG